MMFRFGLRCLVLTVCLSACTAPPAAPPTALPTALPTAPPTPAAGQTRRDGRGVMQVWVPAGEFELGTHPEQAQALLALPDLPGFVRAELPSEQPARRARLTRGYWIDQTEVTNAAFQVFVAEQGYQTPAYWSPDGRAWLEKNPNRRACTGAAAQAAPDLPCVNVTWFEAEAYAAWRGGRLPGEAEWEYAARGPEGRVYPWGDAWDASRANVVDSAGLKPVGSFPSGQSWVGALDLAGNAMEWVADWLDVHFYEQAPGDPWIDPAGPASGKVKIEKGGWWGSNPYVARAAYRHFEDPPGYHDAHIGFRVVSPGAP